MPVRPNAAEQISSIHEQVNKKTWRPEYFFSYGVLKLEETILSIRCRLTSCNT